MSLAHYRSNLSSCVPLIRAGRGVSDPSLQLQQNMHIKDAHFSWGSDKWMNVVKGNPLWTRSLQFITHAFCCITHILAVWLHLSAPHFANLYNGEINCHPLNLPFRAIVKAKWYNGLALSSRSIVTLGLDFPMSFLKKSFFSWLNIFFLW